MGYRLPHNIAAPELIEPGRKPVGPVRFNPNSGVYPAIAVLPNDPFVVGEFGLGERLTLVGQGKDGSHRVHNDGNQFANAWAQRARTTYTIFCEFQVIASSSQENIFRVGGTINKVELLRRTGAFDLKVSQTSAGTPTFTYDTQDSGTIDFDTGERQRFGMVHDGTNITLFFYNVDRDLWFETSGTGTPPESNTTGFDLGPSDSGSEVDIHTFWMQEAPASLELMRDIVKNDPYQIIESTTPSLYIPTDDSVLPILPAKLKSPELIEPNRKPAAEMEIDWNHWAADKLAHCYIMQGPQLIDLVTGKTVDIYEGGDTDWQFKTANGVPCWEQDISTLANRVPLLYQQGGSGTIYNVNVGDDITCIGHIQPYSIGTYYHYFGGCENSGIGKWYRMNINIDGELRFVVSGSSTLDLTDYIISANENVILGASIKWSKTTSGNYDKVAALIPSDNNFYTTSNTGNTPSLNTITDPSIGNSGASSTSGCLDGNMRFNFFWKGRAFDEAEFEALMRDPYQLLKPKAPAMMPRQKGGDYNLPDPRFEYPALFIPNKKPTVPVEIDESHWLAESTLLLSLMEGSPKNLKQGGTSLTPERTYEQVVEGGNAAAYFSDNNQSEYLQIDNPFDFSSDDPWSITFRARHTSADSEGMIMGDDSNNNDYMWMWVPQNKLRIKTGTSTNLDWTITDFTSKARTYTITSDGAGAGACSVSLYVDGELNATLTNKNADFTLATIGQGFVSNQETYRFEGYIEMVHVGNKHLSADEAISFQNNLYQMLVPK